MHSVKLMCSLGRGCNLGTKGSHRALPTVPITKTTQAAIRLTCWPAFFDRILHLPRLYQLQVIVLKLWFPI